MSCRAISQLRFYHLLRGRRGEYRCSQLLSSYGLAWPSIQPQQSASSSAPAWLRTWRPVAFLKKRNHRPLDVPWLRASQARHAAGEANVLVVAGVGAWAGADGRPTLTG
jgi:hypothetical protein